MLSHWKQGAQNWHITKTVNFVKPANFFKNRLRSLEPARNKGFYKHTLKISVFILSTNVWIFFESFILNWEIVFCLPLSRLEGNKRMGLCIVRHLLGVLTKINSTVYGTTCISRSALTLSGIWFSYCMYANKFT